MMDLLINLIVFNYNLFKYFLRPFLLLFFFWDPYNSNVGVFNVVPKVSETVLNSFFFFFKYLFIYFLVVLGLRFCARAFSSCGERGPLSIAVRRPFTIAAALVVEHMLQTRRLSSCGSRAQLLRGTWDLPRPGLEPVSPALAGRFSTTAPPGKPDNYFLISLFQTLKFYF